MWANLVNVAVLSALGDERTGGRSHIPHRRESGWSNRFIRAGQNCAVTIQMTSRIDNIASGTPATLAVSAYRADH